MERSSFRLLGHGVSHPSSKAFLRCFKSASSALCLSLHAGWSVSAVMRKLSGRLHITMPMEMKRIPWLSMSTRRSKLRFILTEMVFYVLRSHDFFADTILFLSRFQHRLQVLIHHCRKQEAHAHHPRNCILLSMVWQRSCLILSEQSF